MKLGLTRNLSLSALLAAAVCDPGSIGAQVGEERFPENLREKIKYAIIIYPENRSFDSLYGSFPGANGLAQATKASATQVLPDGTPYDTLPQPNTGGIPGIMKGPDPRFSPSIPNEPYNVAPYVPIADRHGDLVHRFYTEQYQINNPLYRVGADPKNQGGSPISKFSAYSDNPGLVVSHYDAQYSEEGLLAKQYVLCDNNFHSAFGGSFLNHQWLIAARTPIWPANPMEGSPPSPSSATVFDSNGFPAVTSNALSDGRLTNDPALPGFDSSNAETMLNDGDYWDVNTVFPLRGPAGGFNAIDPTPPPPGPITQPDTAVGAAEYGSG
jgi:acid phosphatase